MITTFLFIVIASLNFINNSLALTTDPTTVLGTITQTTTIFYTPPTLTSIFYVTYTPPTSVKMVTETATPSTSVVVSVTVANINARGTNLPKFLGGDLTAGNLWLASINSTSESSSTSTVTNSSDGYVETIHKTITSKVTSKFRRGRFWLKDIYTTKITETYYTSSY